MLAQQRWPTSAQHDRRACAPNGKRGNPGCLFPHRTWRTLALVLGW